MARLFGIGVLLWAVFASVGFSLEQAPGPSTRRLPGEAAAAADVDDPTGSLELALDSPPSPLDVLSRVNGAADSTVSISRPLRVWAAGVYEVGDLPTPTGTRRDRDYRPRTPQFVNDERLRAGAVPEYLQTVQGTIMPGLYASSPNAENCGYDLWRVMKDRGNSIIGEDYLASGRLLVTINGIEPDWFSSSVGCIEWYEWTAPDEPLTVAGDGDYWVGDLAHGVWELPAPCRWERVVGFRGTNLGDVIEADAAQRGAVGHLVIDDDTLGIRLRGCQAPAVLTTR